MGGLISKSMSLQMDKQKEFMKENGRITMERQIEMQNQMRERMIATEIARARERFYWLGAFYGVFFLGAFAGYVRFNKTAGLVPLVPLTFLMGYQWDFCYSTKMQRILSEADHIYAQEKHLLRMPGGIPSLNDIEVARKLK